MDIDAEATMSRDEVLARFGVKPLTLRLWAVKGFVNEIRTPGGLIFYRTEEITEMIRQEKSRVRN
jgi:predicted site-specific integrase-resolvase